MAKSKLTKGDTNLMVKYHLDGLNINGPKIGTRSNPMSGVVVSVNEFENELYIEIMKLYAMYERGLLTSVAEFDRLRYLMMKVSPEVYYDLLD